MGGGVELRAGAGIVVIRPNRSGGGYVCGYR